MFGNKFEKMGRALGDWATGEWLIPHYKRLTELYVLSKPEYIRFMFGVPFVHLSMCTWTINLTFSDGKDVKRILDSMVDRHMNNQNKLKGSVSIDNIVVYQPEIEYLRKRFDIKPNTTTNWKTLTELLFEIRQTEYLNALKSGFSDGSRVSNPLGLGPTKPLAASFAQHISITNIHEVLMTLPLSLLETLNDILRFCKKRV